MGTPSKIYDPYTQQYSDMYGASIGSSYDIPLKNNATIINQPDTNAVKEITKNNALDKDDIGNYNDLLYRYNQDGPINNRTNDLLYRYNQDGPINNDILLL